MDIKDRIKALMEHEQMTAAAFAETIGVAQATISHTLGDRNKYPSTDFIMKLHERFNYISLDWLLTGKGDMISNKNIFSNHNLFNIENSENSNHTSASQDNSKESSTNNTSHNHHNITNQEVIYKEMPAKKITEIRIFFDDNTYQIFKPEK